MLVALSKAWSFIRAHWYLPVGLIVAVIIFIVTRNRKSLVDWAKTLQEAQASHGRQVAAIEKAHQAEIDANDRAVRRMIEAEKQIRAEFAKNGKEIDAREEKRLKQTIKKLKDDPRALADELERQTGSRIVIIE
jgi:DNA anti-recombination protein RmuC